VWGSKPLTWAQEQRQYRLLLDVMNDTSGRFPVHKLGIDLGLPSPVPTRWRRPNACGRRIWARKTHLRAPSTGLAGRRWAGWITASACHPTSI